METTHQEIMQYLMSYYLKVEDTEISQLYYFKSILFRKLLYYRTMNKLVRETKFMKGKIWLPTKYEEQMFKSLDELNKLKAFYGFSISKIEFDYV